MTVTIERPATVCRTICLAAAAVFGASCTPAPPDAVSGEFVVDDRGRRHDVSIARTRIVSLIPAATETLAAIGATDRLVARTRYDDHPDLASLPSVGGGIDPSLEFLAELAPDLVILWPAAGGGVTLGDRLAEVGLYGYAAEIQTVADFNRLARNLGRLVGLGDRADALVEGVRAQLADVRQAWSGRDPVEVMYVVQHEPPMTVGPGTFLDSVLAAAGGVGAFHDIRGNWPLVSMEEVVLRDPEFLVVPVVGYGTPPVPLESPDPSAARLAQLPGWSAVPAVQAGRVISVDASLFGRPGPRMGDAARYLASRLHGTTFRIPAAAASSARRAPP